MAKRTTLTLKRSGAFAFTAVGATHCGMVADGERQQCNYLVEVRCTARLDKNGYLFEQLVVQDYFDKIRRVASTCERLVMRVADDLHDIMLEENPEIGIIWIKVTLTAAPYAASMTYKYHPS